MNQLRNQPMGVFSFPEEYQAPQALGLQINYNRQDIHMQHNYQVFLHFFIFKRISMNDLLKRRNNFHTIFSFFLNESKC